MKEVKISTDFIELQQLLKKESIISSGGQAKYFLQENDCFVNDVKETRRGKKLYKGDIIKVLDYELIIG